MLPTRWTNHRETRLRRRFPPASANARLPLRVAPRCAHPPSAPLLPSSASGSPQLRKFFRASVSKSSSRFINHKTINYHENYHHARAGKRLTATINKVEKNDAALQKALQTKKDAAADAVNSAKKAAEAKKAADTKALQDKLDAAKNAIDAKKSADTKALQDKLNAAKDAVDAKKATDTKALQDKANAVNAAVKALKE